MYEQSLLCGIMNDWYGSMEDLFQDLKHYGFEVLESNRESITVSCDDAVILSRFAWCLVEPSGRLLLRILKKFIGRIKS